MFGSFDLQHEDIVGVEVGLESLRMRGGQVDVGLDVETEDLLQVPAEERQGWPSTVHPLQDQGRPVAELGEDRIGIGQPVKVLDAPGGSGLAVLGEAELVPVKIEDQAIDGLYREEPRIVP